VGIVALIVIGPKELPVVFRKVGQFVGKAKGMARDFSSAMHDAAKESGMEDAMESMNSITDTVHMVGDPTPKWKDFVPGPETTKLVKKRANQKKKMHEAAAKKSQGRLGSVKAENAKEVVNSSSVPPDKPAFKKTAPQKLAAKKVAVTKKLAKEASKPLTKKVTGKRLGKKVLESTKTNKSGKVK
ncbi:MAG: twin-arginine translocase subunit TatB, partial [Planktomarina sp.]|nr:twin-arginine translocase subunit TatB [Planktomarina sp.]